MRAALGLAVGALLLVGTTTSFAQGAPGANAELKMANGTSVGMATFTQESGGVRIQGQFKGLPSGQHGIHVHASGKCDTPDFMTAGGHFNPMNKQHGLKNPEGAHIGDIENLTVGADGSGTINALLKDATLSAGSGSLFGPDGSALMIHANPDDDMTDPSGNSGGRIACGVIMRVGAAPAAQPSPAASPIAPVAPAAQPAAAPKPAGPAAPSQAPAPVASPSSLPRTGTAGLPVDASLPAAITGLAAVVTGFVISRRRR